MASVFKEAIVNRPFVVLNVRLLPLTLGHLFLLNEIGTDIINSGEITCDDLVASVFVCSHDSERSRELLNSRSIGTRLRLWGLSCKRLSLVHELMRFRAYVDHYTKLPSFSLVDKGGDSLRSSDEFRTLNMLMVDYGMSRDQAMLTSMLEANCLWATEAERRGHIRLGGMTRHQEDFWQQVQSLKSQQARN